MEKRFHLFLLLIVLPLFFLSCSRQVSNLHLGKDLVIYPAPPDTTRIQFLTTIGNSLDIIGKRSGLARFVLGDPKPLPIVKPYGIAMSKNRIYVCDVGIGGLEFLDLEKKSFDYFMPKGRGQLKMPSNCCVDAEGLLYVADAGRRQVVVFDQQGQYVDAFGEAGDSKPTDVAVTGDKIWVPDAKHHEVNVYDKLTRKILYSFPDTTETGDLHLFQPVNICVTNDKVYVTDFGDFRIKSYTHKGEFISAIGSYGNGLGQFVRPKGIAVDKDANLFVADAAFENVQIFNKNGQLLMFFGGANKGPGDLGLPAKVITDYDHLNYFQQYVDPGFKLKYLILVTNQFGTDKINVYGAVEIKK
jgi:DNA-binding beta-propeller fold protein YncE